MNHHRRMDSVERAPLEEESFAVAELFGRRADDRQRDAEIVDEVAQRDRGAEPDRGDQVVSAGVTDHGQRVVFRTDREAEWTRAGPREKCGRQVANAELYR